jgi:hypothetical protein
MIIPVILSSDKMQLTMFQDKMAYPIYLTIRNIPKDIHCKPSHHTQILIGYILTTKLGAITNKTGCCHALANLFHGCMQNVLGPINSYGETGITIMSSDIVWHRCHLLQASGLHRLFMVSLTRVPLICSHLMLWTGLGLSLPEAIKFVI